MITGRAVRIREPGDASVLELVSREVREPGPGEVRVAVHACGLNRADLMQRRGLYPAPPGVPSDVPGLEHAGVVEALGLGVTEWAPGDRVMGITPGGAMASHVVVHARELVRVPDGLSLTDAAAIPEVFMTAWDALFEQAALRPGMNVLVHAIGSGIGTAALQIAQRFGARVIGTSRSAEKLERCRALGLEDGLVVTASRETPPSFAAEVHARTGRGADLILDTVGAAYLEESVRALAPRGTIVCLGLLAGAQGALPMGLLLAKRARIVGSVLRSRPLEEKIALAQRFGREAVPLFARGELRERESFTRTNGSTGFGGSAPNSPRLRGGELRPVIDRVMPLAEVAEAHRAMEADLNVGKIVLEV